MKLDEIEAKAYRTLPLDSPCLYLNSREVVALIKCVRAADAMRRGGVVLSIAQWDDYDAARSQLEQSP